MLSRNPISLRAISTLWKRIFDDDGPSFGDDPDDPSLGFIITNDSPHGDVELESFSYQLQFSGNIVYFEVIDGELPEDLTINPATGLISGTLREMDEYVPEFEPPSVIDTTTDGTHYASFGSAAAETKMFTFEIEGTDNNNNRTSATFSINKRNNYSSDRDNFIRQMTEDFGQVDFDGQLKYFRVNGNLVTADEYIAHQKSQGLFPDRG